MVRRGEVGDFDLELLSERIDKQFVAECLSTVYRLSAMLAMGMGLAFLSTKQVVFGNRRGAALSHFEFNRRYKRTCALQLAAAFPPLMFGCYLFDGSKMSVHGFVKVFYGAFTTGYVAAFLGQIIMATLSRNAVLQVMEPELVTAMTQAAMGPGVPLTSLPWVLRDHGFQPTPLTTFASEFLVDCVASPLLEEGAKLWIVLRSGVLPRHGTALGRVTSVHSYLGYLIAAAMGLKMADNLRRVCLYTRPEHHQKVFFAFMRGLFPVHEICASLTAMELAKRDILAKHVPVVWMVSFFRMRVIM